MLEVTQQIRELHGCAPDSIPEEVLRSSEPLVLRGLAADWPLVEAAKKSAKDARSYIRQFDSGDPLTVFKGNSGTDGRIFYNSDFSGFNFDALRLSLSDVFASLDTPEQDGEPPMLYVGSTMIDKWLPGFREENDLKLAQREPIASIWMGNRSRIAAHYDVPTNIACSVAGRRRFTVFPPNQLKNLYVGPLDFTPAGQPISLVDFVKPDYDQFPQFRDALKVAQVVELEPGDALLIPSMWWHHVEALDSFNVLVNYWWRDTPAYLGPPINALQHAMMSLRDLPPAQREAWKQIFDHYVFDQKEEHIQHIPKQVRGVLNTMDEPLARNIRKLLLSKFKQN